MKPDPIQSSASLHTHDGRRKYLTAKERARFIAAASRHPRRDVGALCLLLIHSGCRISEALALTGAGVNLSDHTVAIRSLKKRGALMVREIPLPDPVLRRLAGLAPGRDGALWPMSRGRAWQLVRAVMREAAIPAGPHACPRGLRHGFGVHAIRCSIPLTLVQRWLGHASLTTTTLYTQVLGQEERDIATRMWG